ncbi:MAG: IS66 family transposase [Reichenbachiella sp.]
MRNAANTEEIDYESLYKESLMTIKGVEKTLQEERAKSDKKLVSKEERIQELTFQLDRIRKYLFGQKSEKLTTANLDEDQLNIFDLSTPTEQQEELSEQVETPQPEKTTKKRAKGTGRMILPENLRREEIIIEPNEDVSDCIKIGEEVTEVLDLIPAEFYVKRYVRPKYAQQDGSGIITGQLPDRVINKGIPSEGVLAQMAVDKYVYGLPLHRQIDKYRRMGVNIPASTASDWMMKNGKHLSPLWELLKLLINQQKYLQADETPIKVQNRQHKNNMHRGFLWVYHVPADRLVLFDYQKGRSTHGPKNILQGYEGILQTDGYIVYEKLYGQHQDIMLIYCMAHARRKFVDALKYDKSKATQALVQIQLLYKLEKEMKEAGADWQEKTRRRQKEAVPVLQGLKNWMLAQAAQVPPSSPLGKAIAYSLPRWDGLSAYAEHGQVEIDNNLAENAIRPIAIGRKNYLFAGSHQAAEMTAMMYSFMATCKKNNVDEFEWLKDVMLRIQDHKQNNLYQLLPNNWEKYKPNP